MRRWGVLGPIAKQKGWAPGAIMDWKTGPAGWVLWVSLAIMLGDSLSSLALLAVTTTKHLLQQRQAKPPRIHSNLLSAGALLPAVPRALATGQYGR